MRHLNLSHHRGLNKGLKSIFPHTPAKMILSASSNMTKIYSFRIFFGFAFILPFYHYFPLQLLSFPPSLSQFPYFLLPFFIFITPKDTADIPRRWGGGVLCFRRFHCTFQALQYVYLDRMRFLGKEEIFVKELLEFLLHHKSLEYLGMVAIFSIINTLIHLSQSCNLLQ